jgi:hypothetical protein
VGESPLKLPQQGNLDRVSSPEQSSGRTAPAHLIYISTSYTEGVRGASCPPAGHGAELRFNQRFLGNRITDKTAGKFFLHFFIFLIIINLTVLVIFKEEAEMGVFTGRIHASQNSCPR